MHQNRPHSTTTPPHSLQNFYFFVFFSEMFLLRGRFRGASHFAKISKIARTQSRNLKPHHHFFYFFSGKCFCERPRPWGKLFRQKHENRPRVIITTPTSIHKFLFFLFFFKTIVPRGRFRMATLSVISRPRSVAGKRYLAGRVCGWLKKEFF